MRIKSLDGLRVVFILLVFTSHAGFALRNMLSVEYFFMLSAFFIYLKYRETSVSFHSMLLFTAKHMKKVIPVHVVMFVLCVLVKYPSVPFEDSHFIAKGILSFFLLNGLLPDPYIFNDPEWFLSVLMLLYFIALPMVKLLNKYRKHVDAMLGMLLCAQYIFNDIALRHAISIYSNPLYRVSDFVLGMLAAEKFLQLSNKKIKGDYFELANTVLAVGGICFYIVSTYILETSNCFAVVFVLTLIILAFDKGWLAKFLSSRPIQFFASFSMEFYMSHILILHCVKLVFADLTTWMIYIIALPLSIAGAFALSRTVSKIPLPSFDKKPI